MRLCAFVAIFLEPLRGLVLFLKLRQSTMIAMGKKLRIVESFPLSVDGERALKRGCCRYIDWFVSALTRDLHAIILQTTSAEVSAPKANSAGIHVVLPKENALVRAIV